MRYKKTTSLLVMAAVLGGATACSQPDPKEQVSKALSQESNTTESSTKIHLETDPNTLVQIAKESMTGKDGQAPDEKTMNALKTFATVNLTLESKSKDGKPLKDATDLSKMDYGFFMDLGSDRIMNVLGTNNNLFVKADVYKLGEKTGLYDKSSVDSIKQAAPAPWAKDVIDNKWVGLDENLSKKFTEQALGQKGNEAANLTPQEVQQLQDAMRKNILDNGTFTKSENDMTKVELPVKKVVPQFINDMKRIKPKALSAEDEQKVNKVLGYMKDDAKAVALLKVKDDKITQVKADVMQIFKLMDPNKVPADQKKDVEKFSKYTITVVSDYKEKAEQLQAPSEYTKVSAEDLQALGMGL